MTKRVLLVLVLCAGACGDDDAPRPDGAVAPSADAGADAAGGADAAPADADGPDDATPVSFATHVDFTTGAMTYGIALGDVDGDGKLDLIVASSNLDAVSILINTTVTGATTPSFAAQLDVPTATFPASVVVADFNDDGRLDLAVGCATPPNQVSVLLNTTPAAGATPSFAARVDYPVPNGFPSLVSADFDGDGRPDVALSSGSGTNDTVSVLLNQTATDATTPSFAAATSFAVSPSPQYIAVGDLAGDAKPDVLVSSYSPGKLGVLVNTTTVAGTPSLSAPHELPIASLCYSSGVGDFNGDGRLDIVGNCQISKMPAAQWVLLNTTPAGVAAPSFGAVQDFPVNAGGNSFAVADLNGDGKPDQTLASGPLVTILLDTTPTGATSASFSQPITVSTGPSSVAAAIGDINGDGKPDLASGITNGVSVLLAE